MTYKISKKKIDKIRKAQIIDEINNPWLRIGNGGLILKNPLSCAKLIYNRDE